MGIILNNLSVLRAVAWVHHQKYHFKREFVMALQLLKKLRHQHGVLTTRDTDCHFIPFLDQLIFADCFRKTAPDCFAELLTDTLFNIQICFSLLFLPRLLLHALHKPCQITALQTDSIYAFFLKGTDQLFTVLALLAINDQLFPRIL